MSPNTRLPRLLLPLLAVTALAHTPAGAADFVTSIDASACAVWGPWSLGDDKQPMRYQGPCVKGKAEGRGKAQWLNPYRFKEGKEEVDATWEGTFRQGVFIGDQPFKGRLDGCKLEDDSLVQARMRSAQEAVVAACPSNAPFRAVDVVLWRAPLIADEKGQEPLALAKGSVVLDNGKPAEVRAYRNDASQAVRQKQAEAERATKRNQARQAFHRFSAENKVQVWLTASQADKDPFKWQGKTVAMTVKLDRMLSPTVAWVFDADRSGYRYAPMLLKGVNSDTFGKLDTAVVVGRLDGRKKAADLGVSGSNDSIEASTLDVVHARACEQRQCMEWFGWDVHKEMTWGEPFKAAP